jgi:hypothetical protein
MAIFLVTDGSSPIEIASALLRLLTDYPVESGTVCEILLTNNKVARKRRIGDGTALIGYRVL